MKMKIQVHYNTAADVPDQIETFMHCGKCLRELPPDTSPKEYARTQIGVLADGRLQVWCNRHECNVAVLSMTAVPTTTKTKPTVKHAHGEEACAICDSAFGEGFGE
jgi:hypothetical protein